MIKTILVGLDGSEHSRTAVQYAFWLARRLGASVVGCHIIDVMSIEGPFLHDIAGSLGFEPYLDFSSKMREVLQERGRGLLQAFSDEAARQGARAETAMGLGVVANELAERARLADLVVVGHRGVNERFSTGLSGSTVESLSRKSPKPVFIAPLQFRECTNPLLAYDGSARAAAAMHVAAECCVTLGLPLTVLTVDKDETHGGKILDEARAYLHSYEISARFESQTAAQAPERIAAYLREQGHDLLFIGAHGHGRIIEMVLGSTTEYLLRNTTCPVFVNR